MADDKTPNKPGFPDVTKNNEEIARKVAEQDAAGHSTVMTAKDLEDTSSALDKLAAAHDKKVADEKAAKGEEPEVVEGDKKDEGTPPAPAPDKKDEGTPPTPDKKDEGTPPVQPTPEEIAKQKADEEAKAEAQKKADEFFKDSPKLPPGASHKSSEAFSSIKIKAAQEISAREQAIEALKKEKAELEERVKNVPAPESLKELEELRQWRAKLDVEASPRFQEFDKKVASSREFIYAQLKRSPSITPEIIEQIKKYGGPDMVNMDKILAAVEDPATKRIIESRLADIEMEKFNKEKAVNETKENITKYLDEQKQNFAKSATAHNEATKAQFTEYTSKLPWMKEVAVDEKADANAKKAAEAHNAFVKNVKGQLDTALNDDSPDMRAILLTGMAQLLYTQKVLDARTAELAATKKSLDEVNAAMEKIKKSGTRLRETSAPPNGGAAPKPKTDNFHSRPGDALDAIAQQVAEERARKAAAGN